MRQVNATSILYDLVAKIEDQNSGRVGLILEHCPETRMREPVTRGIDQEMKEADTTVGGTEWYRGKEGGGGDGLRRGVFVCGGREDEMRVRWKFGIFSTATMLEAARATGVPGPLNPQLPASSSATWRSHTSTSQPQLFRPTELTRIFADSPYDWQLGHQAYRN